MCRWWHLRTWGSGELGSVRLMIELHDLRGFFSNRNDYVILSVLGFFDGNKNVVRCLRHDICIFGLHLPLKYLSTLESFIEIIALDQTWRVQGRHVFCWLSTLTYLLSRVIFYLWTPLCKLLSEMKTNTLWWLSENSKCWHVLCPCLCRKSLISIFNFPYSLQGLYTFIQQNFFCEDDQCI